MRFRNIICCWFATLILSACTPSTPQPPADAPAAEPANSSAAKPDNRPSADSKSEDKIVRASEYFNPLTTEEIRAGWISLFDGETLFGWTASNDANWTVTDKAIHADSATSPGLLLTYVPFADFELRCEVNLAAGGNSGIFLRTTADPKDPTKDCYELNISDTHPEYKSASLVGRAQPSHPVQLDDGWHSYHIRCVGPQITVTVDGEQLLDFTDESDNKHLVGLIGLQMNVGEVSFRNITLRPLSMESLFDGNVANNENIISGWHVVPGSKSEFVVDEQGIHVTNGRGFLESDKTYDDFVFQAASITHGQDLNSGYFFRTITGTADAPDNGYEVQIHNGIENGNPDQPSNWGTGAIFRRIPARRVVSEDNEWTTTTLVAAGPKIAVWVEGYPVVAWTDERTPDENPRRGLRTEAGHFSLQGHDPTTDLHFRDLKVAPLPKQ